MSTQLSFFPKNTSKNKNTTDKTRAARSGTFIDNMKLPVHRWFRYSAGFSAEWVASEVVNRVPDPAQRIFLDPFAGSGTAPLAAASVGMRAYGFESHPFIFRVARAKQVRCSDTDRLRELAEKIVSDAKGNESIKPQTESPLLLKCYDPAALVRLEAMRDAYLCSKTDDEVWELIWLALTAILRVCSGVGTAQWQYVLPNKSKAKVSEPYSAFLEKIDQLISDTQDVAALGWNTAKMLLTDARNPQFDTHKVDLVVTSPPYPNNYDYADATRLEMTFWQEISSWGDLQSAVRHLLIRSCSQHSAAEKLQLDELLCDPLIDPIKDEISAVCRELEKVRLTRGGRKTYHTMIAAYFIDLAGVWRALRRVTTENAQICFVIGDSAPYGVYVPVDEWLGTLALSAGYASFSFEKIRDRNIKWKNRKHRVPLKEGRLWVE